jgi:hypothetical protein
MKLRSTCMWVVIAGATLALVGCGGTTFTSGLDGGTNDDAAGTPDGGVNPDSSTGPSCPPTAPTSGGACPSVGFECEYGQNANPSCNTIAQCTATGWMYTGNTLCPVGTCPASYAVASMGDTCMPQGLICGYPEGTCSCGFGFGGPIRLDAGGPHWVCQQTSPGCPSPRPDIGSACTPEGQMCDYGACAGGVALDCSGGVWRRAFFACPAG